MPMSRAKIATDSGAKLMNRLCKHWAHKLKVEQGEEESRVAFEEGSCIMRAEPDKLIVAVEAVSALSSGTKAEPALFMEAVIATDNYRRVIAYKSARVPMALQSTNWLTT